MKFNYTSNQIKGDMIKTLIRHFLRLAIVFTAVFSLSGCATPPTKPNSPYTGFLPELDEIAKKNVLLATELRKLPELQDGISAAERDALKNLVKMYESAPDAFDSTFGEMYKVGLPNVRKYCSPLQALFWLVEDGSLETCNRILSAYHQDDLIRSAWYFQESINLSMEQLKIIINTLPQEKQRMYDDVTNRYTANSTTLFLYNENQEYFSKESKKIIKDAISHDKYHLRWGDYETVVERLNSPKLLNFYQRWNFTYWTDRGSRHGRSKLLFKWKKGDCRDYTAFSVYCLQKAGYGARAIKVVSPSYSAFHVVCEYKENGKEYIMDNSCTRCGSGEGITEKQIYVKVLPQVGTGYRHD